MVVWGAKLYFSLVKIEVEYDPTVGIELAFNPTADGMGAYPGNRCCGYLFCLKTRKDNLTAGIKIDFNPTACIKNASIP
jgi:hypothetical protein